VFRFGSNFEVLSSGFGTCRDLRFYSNSEHEHRTPNPESGTELEHEPSTEHREA